MKKSLTLLLAIAMVISMFATAAFAADSSLSAQQKFDALKQAGVFTGYPDGTAGLDKEMTRAEFAKVLALVNQLDVNASASTYSDVPDAHWAAGYIGAVTEAGLVIGVGNGKFDPNGKVTIEQLAKTLVLSLGLEESADPAPGATSAWAKGYVAAAVKAGLLDEMVSYKVNAKRELLVDAAYQVVQMTFVQVTGTKVVDDKNIEVTFSDGATEKVALTTALEAGKATDVKVTHNDKEYTVSVTLEQAAVSAAQTDKGEITVTFNRAMTATEKSGMTFDLKSGLVAYTVTPKWADDNKSVVLTSTYLPAFEYTLTVKGFDPITVKVADEVASKIEITANSLQKVDAYDLGVVVTNQFGKEIANPNINVSAYNATQGKTLPVTITADSKEQVDLLADTNSKVDDTIVVTALLNGSTLSASKTFKVVAGSAATSIKLGTVAPLTDKARISVNEEGLVLPVELTDQYGQKITLPDFEEVVGTDNIVIIGGITFFVDGNLVNKIIVKDGVVTFNTGATSGTAVINAINTATGASGSTTVQVSAGAVVKTIQLSNPGVIVAENEEVKIPFAAVDSFGAPIVGTDVVVSPVASSDKVSFTSNVAFAAGYPKINGKGELLFKFAQDGVNADRTAYIYAYVNGAQVGQLQLTVKEESKAVKVNGIKDVPAYFEVGSSADFDLDNITYVDTYNRTNTVADSTYDISITGTSVTYDATNNKLVASGTVTGKSTINVSLNTVAGDAAFTYDVNVVPSSDIKTYGISTINTIFGKSDQVATSDHAVTVELVGKLSGGSVVNLVNKNPDFVTSSDTSIINVDGNTIFGLKAGKATISAWKNGASVAQQEVTVSEAASVATTVTLDQADYTISAVGGTVTPVVTVKDQYGVEITPNGHLVSSDTTVASVDGTGKVTGNKVGSATLTYVTSNSVTAVATVTVG